MCVKMWTNMPKIKNIKRWNYSASGKTLVSIYWLGSYDSIFPPFCLSPKREER